MGIFNKSDEDINKEILSDNLPAGVGTWRDKDGNIKMHDVSLVSEELRVAKAEGFISLKNETIEQVRNNSIPKGNVLALSKTAGIIAAKQTPYLIPMCHSINMTHCDIRFFFAEEGIRVICSVRSIDRTGAEMEALIAVSVTLLNIYDMLKPIDKGMVISDIRLADKKNTT